jgi:hypothetical protein
MPVEELESVIQVGTAILSEIERGCGVPQLLCKQLAAAGFTPPFRVSQIPGPSQEGSIALGRIEPPAWQLGQHFEVISGSAEITASGQPVSDRNCGVEFGGREAMWSFRLRLVTLLWWSEIFRIGSATLGG